MECLPSHRTKRLYSLDRSFFKRPKSHYDAEWNSFMRKTKWKAK